MGKGKSPVSQKGKKCKTKTESSGRFVTLELWVFLWKLQRGEKIEKNVDAGDKWVKACVHDY